MESILNSVNDMFRWKLDKSDLLSGDNIINKPAIEKFYSEETDLLGWDDTDVLYSFTMTYYLGISLYNADRFADLLKYEKRIAGNSKLCRYSTKFLYKCSKDVAFKDFNENSDLVQFIKSYYSLGNVIPIWPGGNEARGKKGIYDIPELFFNMNPSWTKTLIRLYSKACLKKVAKNNGTLLIGKSLDEQGSKTKRYRDAFKDVNTFIECVKANTDFTNGTGFYFDYLKHRTQVINMREECLLQALDDLS